MGIIQSLRLHLGTNSWRVFSSKRFANFDFSSNFEHSFTLQTWLRLASNFAKTRFRRSPTFHFSTSKNFFETSNGRLPPKHGSDRRETLPKRVSDDPRHFIFRRRKIFFGETNRSRNCVCRSFWQVLEERSYMKMEVTGGFLAIFC